MSDKEWDVRKTREQLASVLCDNKAVLAGYPEHFVELVDAQRRFDEAAQTLKRAEETLGYAESAMTSAAQRLARAEDLASTYIAKQRAERVGDKAGILSQPNERAT